MTAGFSTSALSLLFFSGFDCRILKGKDNAIKKKDKKQTQTHNTQASKKDLGVKLCFSERNVKKTI